LVRCPALCIAVTQHARARAAFKTTARAFSRGAERGLQLRPQHSQHAFHLPPLPRVVGCSCVARSYTSHRAPHTAKGASPPGCAATTRAPLLVFIYLPTLHRISPRRLRCPRDRTGLPPTYLVCRLPQACLTYHTKTLPTYPFFRSIPAFSQACHYTVPPCPPPPHSHTTPIHHTTHHHHHHAPTHHTPPCTAYYPPTYNTYTSLCTAHLPTPCAHALTPWIHTFWRFTRRYTTLRIPRRTCGCCALHYTFCAHCRRADYLRRLRTACRPSYAWHCTHFLRALQRRAA